MARVPSDARAQCGHGRQRGEPRRHYVVVTLKEVLPRAMSCMFEDGIMNWHYMEGFLQLLEAQSKKSIEWEDMINSFREWIVYLVASTTT